MKREEGYIKFDLKFNKTDPIIDDKELNAVNEWRTKLFSLGLIGMYPDGIGFGNISFRKEDAFIITGSATGKYSVLDSSHYTMVNAYDLKRNFCECTGPIVASSESMSHAAMYDSSDLINAVIHIHNEMLWKKYYDSLPTTSEKASFGTVELAEELLQLLKNKNILEKGVILTKGHREGIITFGENLEEAGNRLLTLLL